jgi:hypothetical protein
MGEIRVWCEHHFRPASTGLNGDMATSHLVRLLMRNREFMERCGMDLEIGRQADPNRIEAEAIKLGPICCYLGNGVVSMVWDLVRDTQAASAIVRHRRKDGAGGPASGLEVKL